ncbi:MAG: hypothetical protein D6737_14840 [Chloroflexi bacterium]|nr:MAG: hypothetical protein CUN54_02515 [Phototrophicales bacterium]RMF78415.1 MAG: hypothetical protein D6737_14840 [Chloroflexota bacterium]
MRQFSIFVGLILLLIIGGSITYQVAYNGEDSLASLAVQQVDDPEGSTVLVAPSQAALLVIIGGVVFGGMLSMGIGLAVVMWFLDRSLHQIRAESSDEGETAVAKQA